MLKKENVEHIWKEVCSLTSLARILENNFEKNDEIDTTELWVLVSVIKEHLISLNEYLKNLDTKVLKSN